MNNSIQLPKQVLQEKKGDEKLDSNNFVLKNFVKKLLKNWSSQNEKTYYGRRLQTKQTSKPGSPEIE